MTATGNPGWDWRDTTSGSPRPQRVTQPDTPGGIRPSPPHRPATTARSLPPAEALTYWQSAGRACVWCRRRLTSGAVSAGTARGRQGAHVLDVETFACPDCTNTSIPTPRPGDPA